jgi:hypothetical protein
MYFYGDFHYFKRLMTPFRTLSVFPFLILLIFSPNPLSSQVSDLRANTISIYIDCGFCDSDHIRREITWVNYVREPREADVHILLTTESTGSGGKKVILFFYGQLGFQGINDSLHFFLAPDDSDDTERNMLVRHLRIGLFPYLKNSHLLQYADIHITIPDTNSVTESKWNNWVFSLSTYGNFNSNKNYLSFSLSNSFTADHITEKFKSETSFDQSFTESRFDSDDYYYRSINRSYSFYHRDVFALSDHWSAGFWLGANSSTYSNLRLKYYLIPAIEYNLFPYQESTSRQLRLSYTLGPQQHIYYDTTIYNKSSEMLFRHSLNISAQFVQKWGSIWLNTSYSNYLHDFSLNRLNFNARTNLRIAKGLELSLYSSYSIIHDQISLPKGEATPEELLLQQRELKTTYNLYFYGGLTYTFGNLYNNVVNPRFN